MKRNMIKILALALCLMLMLSLGAVVASAAAASTDGNAETGNSLYKTEGTDLGFGERVEYAVQGTVTGLLMVFAVLALLAVVVSLSKVILYDIPRKAEAKAAAKAAQEGAKAVTATEEVKDETPDSAISAETSDDGELIAVITAAIAATIESGEYGNEFASGFRVVSFKRVTAGSWNKNN